MADKKLNELATASDGAYIYAETSDGAQVRISKADLASVVAQQIHDVSTNQGKITFGATTSAELASVVAQQSAMTDKVKAEAIPTGGTYESVQLWEGGCHWAKWNVGASNETEYGDLFAWGATKPYRLNGTSVLDNTGDYSSSKAATITTDLKPNEDAATINMGAGWRMPTKAEFDALLANTDATWTTIGGVNGRKFADKRDANNYIFFPASGLVSGSALYYRGSFGYCWERSFNSSSSAWLLYFYSSVQGTNTDPRNYGFSVRGVRA